MDSAGDGSVSVLPWAQTAVDGQWAAPLADVRPGAVWTCRGEAIFLTGPTGAAIDPDLRARARAVMQRLWPRLATSPPDMAASPAPELTVTEGRRLWSMQLVLPPSGAPLLVAMGGLPPCDCDLWVVRADLPPPHPVPGAAITGLLATCHVLTDRGPQMVASLVPGQRLQTHDGGLVTLTALAAQPVTGARLAALPHMAPICLRPGALGRATPDRPVFLAPDQLVLLRSRQAQALFNCDTVLVAVRDLCNRGTIAPARGLTNVTYCRLTLNLPALILVDGVPCPASEVPADLRRLSTAEAALLDHAARVVA